jgi:alpha-mannosidase
VPERVTIKDLRDLSPSGNPLLTQDLVLDERVAVFTSPDDLKPSTPTEFKPEGLPVKAKDAWTLNFFCRPDSQPEDLTLIAGFGRPVDGRIGTGRYFSKFTEGINFWISNRDVGTKVPLDIGKWQMLTATFDGSVVRLYKNGEKIAEEADVLSDDRPVVEVMPLDAWDRKRIFPGSVRGMTIWNESLSPLAIKRLMEDGKRSLP